jgi:hypothetical protein
MGMGAETGAGCSGASCCNGVACGPNTTCSNGNCVCAYNTCSGHCVNESNDSSNCGACGHNCEGGQCSGGKCQPATLATGIGASGLALDSANLYWIDTVMNNVVQLPLSGGSSVTLASGQVSLAGITVDANSVYWTAFGGGNLMMGTVMKCAIGGCAGNPQTLASDQINPSGIAVEGNNVYWGEYTSSPVYSVPIGGGTPVAVTTMSNGQPAGLAVDSTDVYWVAPGGGTVNKCAIGGCGASPTTLVSGLSFPEYIALDANNVYWSELTTGGSVMKCAKSGCPSGPTTLASGGSPGSIVVVGSTVIWADSSSGILTCDVGGCGMNPTVLISDNANFVAADATHVYWSSNLNRAVKRLVR